MFRKIQFYRQSRLERWRLPRTTIVQIPVPEISQEELQNTLSGVSKQIEKRCQNIDGLHTLRIVALQGTKDNESSLLLNSVHDSPRIDHFKQIYKQFAKDHLSQIKALNTNRESDFIKQMLENRVHHNTYHLGSVNRSVKMIRKDQKLVVACRNFLHENSNSLKTKDEVAICNELREHLKLSHPKLFINGSVVGKYELISRKLVDLVLGFIAIPVVGLLARDIGKAINRISNMSLRLLSWGLFFSWWVYGVLFCLFGMIGVRLVELFEKDEPTLAPNEPLVSQIESKEDLGPGNGVTLHFDVKDSWSRRLLLKIILASAEFGCRHLWTHGKLSEIPTIHYARLLITDHGRKMLFMSDFDGSLNRYLDDFLTVGNLAVVPISSNFKGCPTTRFLFRQLDPANFAQQWKTMIRAVQLPNGIYFRAYPDMTLNEILSNAAFRDELLGSKTISRSRATSALRRIA